MPRPPEVLAEPEAYRVVSAIRNEMLAESVEFVAHPGQTGKLRKAIGLAMRSAQNTCDALMGCMVLVSEQEKRLVTVITLWAGAEESRQRDENSEQVRNVLEPYVDRWMRTRRFVTLFPTSGAYTPAFQGAKPRFRS